MPPNRPAEESLDSSSTPQWPRANDDGIGWRLNALHRKAWGKEWPRRTVTIKQSELGCVSDGWLDEVGHAISSEQDDDISTSMDVELERTYDCLEQVQSVQEACGGTTYTNDVLVIRDEFILLRETLEDYFECGTAALVTGHPDIGKTSFLYYLLLYRLQHRLPTAIQFDSNEFTLFTADGAETRDATVRTILLPACWALVAGNVYVSIPSALFAQASVRSVLASPPRPDRWKEWVKQSSARILVTELPSTLEIAAIARANNMDVARAVDLVRRWGPNIRTVMRILRFGPVAEDNARLAAQAAAQLLCDQPKLEMSSLMPLPNSDTSPILFLRPIRTLDDRGRLVISLFCSGLVPTRWLGDILDAHIRRHPPGQILKLFQVLSPHILTPTAAWYLENSMHSRLVGTSAGAALRISNLDNSASRELRPAVKLLHGTGQALWPLPDAKSMYWLPSIAHFPGVDGVLIDSDNIYAFQATIADEDAFSLFPELQTTSAGKHANPSSGLRKLWKHLEPDVRTRRAWHFVVVAEDGALAGDLASKFARDLEDFAPGGARVKVQTWSSVLTG